MSTPVRLYSRTLECQVAIDLGLTLVVDKRGPNSPRGGTGHVEWEAPAGLLEVVDDSGWWSDAAGSGRKYRHVPSGRLIVQYDGSGWFQPSLTWEVPA
jgi:hypothetical protein